MKRLSGWDAVLLYSETPDRAHAHPQAGGDRARRSQGPQHSASTSSAEVIDGRLYKLDPFRYQLVDIPLKMHHPMWRENCEVDLEYHVRPYRVDSPGGRRQLDEAVGRIASTPLDRSKPLWEMYFIEGLANGRIAVLGKIHHALADGVASANLLARGMDLQDGPPSERRLLRNRPRPEQGRAGALGIRRPHAPHRPAARRDALHRAGHRPGAQEQQEVLIRTHPAVHPAAVVHEPPRRRATQVRHRHTRPCRRQGDGQTPRRHDQRHGARDLGRARYASCP